MREEMGLELGARRENKRGGYRTGGKHGCVKKMGGREELGI
jgi:hypothetical protein